jgi:hypothetical protein
MVESRTHTHKLTFGSEAYASLAFVPQDISVYTQKYNYINKGR